MQTQRVVRNVSVALNSSSRYKFRPPEFDVDYLVIGGGVVGLAISRALVLGRPNKSTYLVERNARVGEETSSRNSEVVHGGFYYPEDSLKTRMCIRGRHLLYEYCESHAVPYKKVGKLVVGLAHQQAYLEGLYKKARSLRWPADPSGGYIWQESTPGRAVPCRMLSGDEARKLEPDLSPEITGALLSEETGIVDSHTLMESLERDISESGVGSVVGGTNVVRVDAAKDGWVVQMTTHSEGSSNATNTDCVLARNIINSTGLSGPFILNSLQDTLIPPGPRIPIWYAKGSYASYHGPGISNVKHLIYPVPETGPKRHGFAGLGTHLTLDLGGNVKFGPDIEWIEPPLPSGADTTTASVTNEEAIDFWKEYLVASSKQIPSMYQSVRQYLPGIQQEGLQPDYVGIRPKLGPPNSGFQDFVIRKDFSGKYIGGKMTEKDGGIMITLLGIESPGLTSSLALAEHVNYIIGDK
ncbi:FAD dependent oxidoreductase [Serendipita vermifera]|nr:FAD dependent oxidoreductase [Serendipita vermifera]